MLGLSVAESGNTINPEWLKPIQLHLKLLLVIQRKGKRPLQGTLRIFLAGKFGSLTVEIYVVL